MNHHIANLNSHIANLASDIKWHRGYERSDRDTRNALQKIELVLREMTQIIEQQQSKIERLENTICQMNHDPESSDD